jgi:hypothetical protein
VCRCILVEYEYIIAYENARHSMISDLYKLKDELSVLAITDFESPEIFR